MAKVILDPAQRAEEKINAWILLQMRYQNKTQSDIGEVLGLRGKNVGDRINGATPWKFGELYRVVTWLGGKFEDIL